MYKTTLSTRVVTVSLSVHGPCVVPMPAAWVPFLFHLGFRLGFSLSVNFRLCVVPMPASWVLFLKPNPYNLNPEPWTISALHLCVLSMCMCLLSLSDPVCLCVSSLPLTLLSPSLSLISLSLMSPSRMSLSQPPLSLLLLSLSLSLSLSGYLCLSLRVSSPMVEMMRETSTKLT